MSGDGGKGKYDRRYTAPRDKSIDCPYCGAHVGVEWRHAGAVATITDAGSLVESAECRVCEGILISLGQTLVYPSGLSGPAPSADMPPLVRSEYDEARKVRAASPRAAAALLRLAIQKLVDELQPGKENLDLKIGILVEDGRIRPRLADMLDVVRVIGNNAVHPGQMDLNDEPGPVDTLFKLVNAIVEQTITLGKIVAEGKSSLPHGAIDGIADRPRRVKERRDRNAG